MAEQTKKDNFNHYALSFGLAQGGGFSLIQATVATYFTIFLTDTYGVDAGAASIMMLCCTLFDAFKNPIIGSIVDATHTKIGRYKTYFIFMPVIYAVMSVLLFTVLPGLSSVWKIVYTSAIYILWSITYSFCLISGNATLPAQTLDLKKRNFAIMLFSSVMALSFTVSASFTTVFTDLLGGYMQLMIVYGILTIPPYIALFFQSKEQYIQPKEKSSLVEEIKTVMKHKELYSVFAVIALSFLSYGVMFSASTYYVIYYLSRSDLITYYMLTISVGALVSMIVLLPLALKIFKTPKKCLIITQSVTVVCFLLLLFIGKSNIILLFIISFMAASICSMQHGLIQMINNDMVDYINLKENVSLNATISSIHAFFMKLGTALTSTLILGILSLTGYVAGGEQSELTLNAINILRFGVPALASTLVVVLMFKYPISKYYPSIQEMKNKNQNNN